MSLAAMSSILGPLIRLFELATSRFNRSRAPRNEVKKIGRLIVNADSGFRVSSLLVKLKNLLDTHLEILESENVNRFYQKWLTDELLNVTGEHPRLITHDNVSSLREVHADAADWL